MIRRLSSEELFHIGPDGLEPISDATLERRLNEVERLALREAAPLLSVPELPENSEDM